MYPIKRLYTFATQDRKAVKKAIDYLFDHSIAFSYQHKTISLKGGTSYSFYMIKIKFVDQENAAKMWKDLNNITERYSFSLGYRR